MLTWHFLHGGSCDTFLAGPFSCLSSLQVDIRPETFWQGLLAEQFAWPAKTLPLSCQDFWTWSCSYRGHSFPTLSVSSFEKDEAISRREEGFCLQSTAVDNAICRVLAQFLSISIFETLYFSMKSLLSFELSQLLIRHYICQVIFSMLIHIHHLC